MELDQVVSRIPLDLRHVLPVIGLRSPDARYPTGGSLQCTLKRLDLTDMATFFPVLNGFVKTGRPFFADQLLYGFRIRKISFNGFVVDFQCSVPYVICFAE